MYYEGIFDHEIVHEDSAFEYAKYHLDRLPDKDKDDFVEWFFSGNWIKREVDENDGNNNNDNNLFDTGCYEENE